MSDTPKKIGRYEITRQIGKGASSRVFLGYDPFADLNVAIKLIDFGESANAQDDKVIRKLLLTEASLAGKLKHPHIVTIYDASIEEGGGYLAMEYVDGGTLEQHTTPQTLLPMADLIEIIFKCCNALDYAYRNGVIHRDIKPANILICGPADIKISDFGAAQLTRGDSTQICNIGSPSYMSPQQAAEQNPLNHQTDIFSLGVVMYQLLCGKLPFKAHSVAATLYQIIHIDPPPPSSCRAEIPVELDWIIARALQKKLSDRYPSWEAFSKDLAAMGNFAVDPQNIADSEKFSSLRKLSFFSEFGDVELWEVLRLSHWSKHPAKTPLLAEGKAGDSFYILAAGSVKVFKGKRTLGVLVAGASFGEMAYVSRPATPRSASVEAIEDVTVIEILAGDLDRATENCQLAFNKTFLRILANRLANANTLFSREYQS